LTPTLCLAVEVGSGISSISC